MAKEKSEMTDFNERRRNIVITVLTMGILSAVGYKFMPFSSPDITSTLDKLVYTARCQVFSLLTLFVGIQLVAFTRLNNPKAIDPLNKEGEKIVDAYSRCLQNTLEQLTLSVPGQLILCTYLEGESLKAIPFLVSLFVVGRVLFWLGYPKRRAAGFALTLIPTFCVYVLNVYYIFTLGPSTGLVGK